MLREAYKLDTLKSDKKWKYVWQILEYYINSVTRLNYLTGNLNCSLDICLREELS